MKYEKSVNEIMHKCQQCGRCIDSCLFLAGLGAFPKRIAERGVAPGEAFSCTLCGACEASCPLGLSPKQLFAAGRIAAVEQGEVDLDDYRYLFPDRKQNIMSIYRQFYGIDYSDIAAKGDNATCFFPGCTMATYSPNLVRQIYNRLRNSCDCGGVLIDCCGKPLEQMGMRQRADNAKQMLLELVQIHNIRKLIAACPGCYYDLREILSPVGVTTQTVYEVLDLPVPKPEGDKFCTVHDSCPDRFEGIFGRQVRKVLEKCGFSIIEMDHSKKTTICCGSGGQISHFRPDLTEKLVELRLEAAKKSGADMLVGYCISCVLKFACKAKGLSVTHALNLLLAEQQDFAGAKEKAVQMLEGPQGREIWKKIMED